MALGRSCRNSGRVGKSAASCRPSAPPGDRRGTGPGARAYYRMGCMNDILRWARSRDSHERFIGRAASLLQQARRRVPHKDRVPAGIGPELATRLGSCSPRLGAAEGGGVGQPRRPGHPEAARRRGPRPARVGQALAGIHNNLGGMLLETGRLKEAEAAQAEALAIRKQLAADIPRPARVRRALAMSHNNLGWLFQTPGGRRKRSRPTATPSPSRSRLVADFPDRPDFRLELAKYRSTWATCSGTVGG